MKNNIKQNNYSFSFNNNQNKKLSDKLPLITNLDSQNNNSLSKKFNNGFKLKKKGKKNNYSIDLTINNNILLNVPNNYETFSNINKKTKNYFNKIKQLKARILMLKIQDESLNVQFMNKQKKVNDLNNIKNEKLEKNKILNDLKLKQIETLNNKKENILKERLFEKEKLKNLFIQNQIKKKEFYNNNLKELKNKRIIFDNKQKKLFELNKEKAKLLKNELEHSILIIEQNKQNKVKEILQNNILKMNENFIKYKKEYDELSKIENLYLNKIKKIKMQKIEHPYFTLYNKMNYSKSAKNMILNKNLNHKRIFTNINNLENSNSNNIIKSENNNNINNNSIIKVKNTNNFGKKRSKSSLKLVINKKKINS